MRKAMIIFAIILIVTILVPMVSIIEMNKSENNTSTSKQMVTIFDSEKSFCRGIVDF